MVNQPDPIDTTWGVRRDYERYRDDQDRLVSTVTFVVTLGPYDDAEVFDNYPRRPIAEAVASALNRVQYMPAPPSPATVHYGLPRTMTPDNAPGCS